MKYGRRWICAILSVLAAVIAPLSMAAADEVSETRIETQFLDPGPFPETDISVIVPYIRVNSAYDLPAAMKNSPNHYFAMMRYNYTSQLSVRRVGDAFAFRLFLHGPDVVERFPASVAQGAYEVIFKPTDTNKSAATIHLGFLTADNFSVVDTDYGPSLVSDWAWSPGHYHHWKTGKEADDIETANRLWQLGREAMAPDGPFVSFSSAMMTIEYHREEDLDREGVRMRFIQPGELYNRQMLEQMVYGDEALRQIEIADTIMANLYGDVADNQARKDAVIGWMKANFNPVAPYKQMQDSCGPIPDGWNENTFAYAGNLDKSSNELIPAVEKLDAYADCIAALWERFDYEAYEALYPEVEKQVAIWVEAGGGLFKEADWIYPKEGYIRGYAHVHPEELDLAFARRIEQASLPNASARLSVSEVLRLEARDRAIEAQEHAERRQAEARRRAAQRQLMLSATGAGTTPSTPSFDDINNFDLLGMQENARIAAETGDTSVLFDAEGQIRTQQAPDLYANAPVTEPRDQNPTQTETRIGTSTPSSNPDTRETAEPPAVPRNRVVFLGSTEPLSLIKGAPNHGCGIPWADNAPEGFGTIDCIEVDTIELYSVSGNFYGNAEEVKASLCPRADMPTEIYGPQVWGRIYRVNNLTEDEAERAVDLGGKELSLYRHMQQDAKSTLEIRLIETYRSDKNTRLFRYVSEANAFLAKAGCPLTEIVDRN